MTIRTTIICGLAAVLTAAASAAPPPTALIALTGSSIVSWEYPASQAIPNAVGVGLSSTSTYSEGLATNAAGELLATYRELFTNSIRRFSPSGQVLTPFISGGTTQFRSLAVAPNEDVLAVAGNTEIRRFDSAGVYQNTPFTVPSTDYLIEDVFVAPDGRGFALQRPRFNPIISTIEIFDPVTGASLGSITMPPGSTPGTTQWTRDMELGPDGNIYFITGPGTSFYRVAPTAGALPFPIAQISDSVSTFAIGPDGLIYAATGQSITRYALDGTNMGVFATFQGGSFTRLHFGNVTGPSDDACLPE